MSKIRVMHVLASESYSGAEHVAITIINHTREMADSVYVSPDGSIHDILLKQKIPHYRIKKICIRELSRAVNKIQPDLIHAHDFRAGLFCSMLKTKVPLISHLHNNAPWLRRFGLYSAAYGISCMRYYKILTVSDCVMDDFIFGTYLRHKSAVIQNPIDTMQIIQKSRQKPDSENDYSLAFLGRLSEPKNPIAFVEITARVYKKRPRVKAVMIGDGELSGQVQERIRYFGLEDVITMTGFLENPYRILKHAKILCMPSKWEGFGLAAVEAMALGKPVICSGAGGLKEIVSEECGKICLHGNEYVKEICRLISDENYYADKSKHARLRAEKLDNRSQYIENIKRIYGKAVKKYENTV